MSSEVPATGDQLGQYPNPIEDHSQITLPSSRVVFLLLVVNKVARAPT